MGTFIKAGGAPGIVTLLFSAALFITAVRYLRTPDERRMRSIIALTVATAFSVLAGIISNVAMVFSRVAGNPEWGHSDEVHLIVMQGLGEALVPGTLGFTAIALAWMLVAVSSGRQRTS